MTPYFGVSLYIWAGILAITLIFLATGYYLGGRLTIGREPQSILALYLLAPLLAALVLLGAALIYPLIFPVTGQGKFNRRQFFGGINAPGPAPDPAVGHESPAYRPGPRVTGTEGDSGAGRVFFISTIGSVAGVIVTAFLIIPNLTNFRAVLGISLGLCAGRRLDCLAGQRVVPVRIGTTAAPVFSGGPAGSAAAMGAARLSAPAGRQQRFRPDGGRSWPNTPPFSATSRWWRCPAANHAPLPTSCMSRTASSRITYDGNGQAVDHTPMMLRWRPRLPPRLNRREYWGWRPGPSPGISKPPACR